MSFDLAELVAAAVEGDGRARGAVGEAEEVAEERRHLCVRRRFDVRRDQHDVAVAPVGPVWAWRMGRLARAVPAVAQLSQAQAAAAYWFCGAAGFGVCALAGLMA